MAPKLSTEQFVKNAVAVHGDTYDYSNVIYVNSGTKVIIICKLHGAFNQVPYSHLRHGCSKCGHKIIADKLRCNTPGFIQKAMRIHGDLYNYSKVNYIKTMSLVIIVCNKHGEFKQTPNNHLSGFGCSKCSYDTMSVALKSNTTEFINKAKQIHGDRYDYSKVEYITATVKVILICSDHGDFKQVPNAHLSQKHGCPKCAQNQQYSKKQIQWIGFLQQYYGIKIQYALNNGEHTIRRTKYKADGYCKETNTIYEFHGFKCLQKKIRASA